VGGLFGREHALPNLARYPFLFAEMHTPLIALALAAPFALRHRDDAAGSALSAGVAAWMALALALAVFACYLFYPAFDAYWRLRFLVPAVPALMALEAAALDALARRLPAAVRGLVLATVGALVVAYGVTYARDHAAFDIEGDYKYPLMGEHVARRLPDRAVLLSMQHSGSIGYYSGRPIVRYDQIPKRRLDRVLTRLRRLGYHPYILLEPWEEPHFRERFAGRSAVGSLDWPPMVELEFATVRIYDPADHRRAASGERVVTEILPWPFPLPR
jgi:hypothetical protein